MPETPPKPPAPLKTVAAPGTLFALALDPRRRAAVVGGSAGEVASLDLAAETWGLTARRSGKRYVSSLAWSTQSDGDTVLVGRYDGSLSAYRFDVEQGSFAESPRWQVAPAHRGWVRDVVLLPDGERLASVGDDLRVKLWSLAEGKLLAEWAGHAELTPQGYVSALYALAATPDGEHVVSGDRVGEIRVWHVATNREVGRFRAPELYTFDPEKRDRSLGGLRRLSFSPDGSRLAAAGIGPVTNVDGFVGPVRVEVWDWQAGKRLQVLEDDHKAVINDVAWSSDGRELFGSGGGDAGGILARWSLEESKPRQKFKFTGHTHRLAWLETDRRLMAAGFEGVQLWDIEGLRT